MPKVALTYENGSQRGPATDYSMLLEMKRRQIQASEVNGYKLAGQNGRKGMGLVVDSQRVRGFGDTPVIGLVAKGPVLGFLKF